MNSTYRKRTNNSGFTLLEVLISMCILAFISLSIYEATTNTYHLRDVLSNEGDFYNGIRLAMSVVERDIELVYSPVIMAPPNENPYVQPNPQDMAVIQSMNLGAPTQYWEGAMDQSGIRPSRLIGTENKLSFISVSHTRMYKDSQESDFAKIAYELDPDDLTEDQLQDSDLAGTKVLTKHESPNAFNPNDGIGSDDSFAHTYPLLHGIQNLTFRYYRHDTDQWSTAWDSDSPDTKNLYPDIIEIKIHVVGPSKLTFDGLYKFRTEIPLHGLNPST